MSRTQPSFQGAHGPGKTRNAEGAGIEADEGWGGGGEETQAAGTPEKAPESGDNEEASQILFTWACEELLGKEVERR